MKPNKEEIIFLAKKTKRYCELLIEQSERWLPAEEDGKNVGKRKFRLLRSKKNKSIQISDL